MQDINLAVVKAGQGLAGKSAAAWSMEDSKEKKKFALKVIKQVKPRELPGFFFFADFQE